MNFGDVIFQLLSFIFMFGLFFAVFFLVRSLMSKQQQPNKNNNIEQKLDRIIELLEQDRK
ncbi:hypothetical protein WQ57_10155 [Mesobacillus campisalis]|uniref:Uncharacterized protein n=1 Tax=Mesobacillus campisalis TaxID=1408103 RepID=A0A0M2SVG8_9BACI|nr:DUF4083 domain-containing protein [Mesobacillus campisalis]KKK38163.1 hypothetical protein WQ57_10155 [Mesobacillus campisalis]